MVLRAVALLLVLGFALVPAQALLAADGSAGDGVGRIVFTTGSVQVETDETTRTVSRGSRIHEGDRIVTGAGGNAQVRFSDGGMLGLRPESAARVHVYRPGGDDEAAVRIRLEVEHGTARSVTGEGGDRDRDGFRLNTPIAAVGVRGTDFTVRTDQQRTRVQVHTGGVGVSPFTAACSREGFGACAGDGARSLFARDADRRVLEVVRGADSARIVEQGRAVPEDEQLPSADDRESKGEDEDSESSSGSSGSSDDADEPPIDADADADAESSIDDPDEDRNASSAIAEAEREAERRERYEAVRDDITWGRWSRVAGEHDTVTEKRRDDQTVVSVNSVFGLLAPRWQRTPEIGLPDSGVVDFNVGSSEAVLLRGNETAPASVTNPELSVDFAKREFRTRLDVVSERLDGAARVEASGQVDPQGRMRADASESNAAVQGVVGPDGDQAGMLFERALNDEVTAAGAIDWFR